MVAAAGGRWAAPVPRVIYVGRRALVGVQEGTRLGPHSLVVPPYDG